MRILAELGGCYIAFCLHSPDGEFIPDENEINKLLDLSGSGWSANEFDGGTPCGQFLIIKFETIPDRDFVKFIQATIEQCASGA